MAAKQNKKKSQQIAQKPIQAKPSVVKNISAALPKWSIIVVLAITAIVYIRAVFGEFTNCWDDDKYIMVNPYIRDLSWNGIKAIFSSFYLSNYHPLTTLTYLFEFSLYGLNPMPYHILNVILHLVNTWLVYKFTEKLSGKRLTALVVSALFALHPMHVESVAWVSERKDVLYTFFYMLSLLAYLRYMSSENKTRHYAAALILFIASMLSKSAAVTLPVILIAIDFYKGRKINAKSLIEKIPFLLPAIFFGILAIMSQKSGGSLKDLSLTYTFFEKIFLFSYTVSFYIVKLAVPFNLSAMHYYPPVDGGSLPWQYYASLPFLLLLTWLVVRKTSFRKEKLFGIFFYLIAISVMLQIIPAGLAITAERYSYVPAIGLFFIAGQWISSIDKRNVQNAFIALLSVYIIFLSFQTWVRIGLWKNTEVLFTDVIKKYPDSNHCYWIRGFVRNINDNLAGAEKDYSKSLEYKPDDKICAITRGSVRYKLGDFKGALEDNNLTIKLDSTIPESYNNRGMDHEALGDLAAALRDYSKAIKLDPKLAMAYNNRGVVKAKSGDMTGAMEDINKSIELDPKEAKPYSDRGNVKAIMKDYTGSIKDFDQAIKLKPDDKLSYFNRGNSRVNMQDTAAACKDWKKALDLGYDMASQAIGRYCR